MTTEGSGSRSFYGPLVLADREMGESFIDEERVTFKTYTLLLSINPGRWWRVRVRALHPT